MSWDCERVNVKLIPRSVNAMSVLATETGLSKTDLINRAIQLYRFVHGVNTSDGELLVRWPGGDTEKVEFL